MKNENDIIQGRWWKIKNNVQKKIEAKYDRIKDWKMDPKGYFLIKVDKEAKKIRVAYCLFSKLGNNPIHDMVAVVKFPAILSTSSPAPRGCLTPLLRFCAANLNIFFKSSRPSRVDFPGLVEMLVRSFIKSDRPRRANLPYILLNRRRPN